MAIYMEALGPSQDQESDLESLLKFPTFEDKPSRAKGNNRWYLQDL